MEKSVLMKIETMFDHNGVMTQVFSKRVKLVVDFKNLVLATLVDERVTDKVHFEKDYSLLDFMRYQRQVADEAERLGGV